MIDYKKSGVDIKAGDDLVDWLQDSPSTSKDSQLTTNKIDWSTFSDVPDYKKRTISGIGGFAALYDGQFKQMEHPVLVTCTDGVGTKLKLATHFNDYSLIGQDLVAMCANDLICTGGTPLFFLDYYATGKLDLSAAKSFLAGVRAACDMSHLTLIGGETAEMPGVYNPPDFDCAGFAVGVVDKNKMWGPSLVQQGDAIIGVSSSGYHSNGYSLLRQLFNGEYEKYRSWLMQPTELYVRAALELKRSVSIHAMAHMTGGGIDNLPRVMPSGLKASIKRWPFPDCFSEVQKRSGLNDQQMRETFNCGIGLMFILPQTQVNKALEILQNCSHVAQVLGSITQGSREEAYVEWL